MESLMRQIEGKVGQGCWNEKKTREDEVGVRMSEKRRKAKRGGSAQMEGEEGRL